MQGTILDVTTQVAGVTLEADTAMGATTLVVSRPEVLPTPTGSLEILVTGDILEYSEVNIETAEVTLATPLPLDLEIADILLVSPRIIEKWALVELQADDDAVLALVPHALWDRLDEGVRDPEAQEYAIVDQREGDWVILDIIGTTPTVSGVYIDPATIPVPETVAGAIEAIDNLAAEVAANTGAIAQNTDAVENVAETAFAASSLASTADGRVSMSDYEPSPEDVEYYATDYAGDFMRGTPWDIVNRELTSNIATVHIEGGGMTMNLAEYVVITNVGAPFDGVHLITAFDADSVSYEVMHADVPLLDPDVDPELTGIGYNTVILQRTEGSIWFTRTRTRRNHITNPSFELNVNDWAATQCFMSREVATTVISGTYTMRIENNSTPGLHYVTWDNGGADNKQAALPAQTWIGSVYVAGVSGSVTNNARIELEFFDATHGSLGVAIGQTAPLIIDDWQRFSVVGVAPADAAYVVMHMVNPNDTAHWRIDGAMLELGNVLGRYFDGRSYDGSWDIAGEPDNSASSLAGGKIISAYELADGSWIEKFFTGFTLRDINANTIRAYAGEPGMDGGVIEDYSIPQDKLSGTPMVASEALDMGDLINVHSVGGLFRMRKADADGPYRADGFVLAAVPSDSIGMMFSHGYNPFMTDLTPGSQFLSTTPGKTSSTPPGAIGTITQRVGTATAETVLNVILGPAVRLT